MAPNGIAQRLGELRIDRSRVRGGRRLRIAVLLGIVAIAILAIAFAALRRPPLVNVSQVREARIGEEKTELSAAGYVVALRRSVIAPKVPGRLEQLLVREGDRVQKGEVIARLDPSDAEVEVRRADAELRAARSTVAAAESRAHNSATELKRSRTLFERGAETSQNVQRAESVAAVAQAERRAGMDRVAAATEALSAAKLALENTVVRAPFSGTVVKKLADEGAVLAPAAIETTNVGGIVELVDLSELEVDAEVSENELRRVKMGQPALVTLDAYPDRVLRGEATSVRPAIDRAKATAVVKIRFLEPPTGVLPDMGARVSLLSEPVDPRTAAKEPRLRVPSSAVKEKDGKSVVMVVKGTRVEPSAVKPLRKVGDDTVLAEGPAPGTQIVSNPRRVLKAGSRIRIAEKKS